MKMKFLFLIVICVFSCEEVNNETPESNDLLIGTWVDPTYNDGKLTYKKVESVPDEDYSLTFKVGGEVLFITSGWCGTPPLSYYSYEGNWQLENNIVSIVYEDFYPASSSWLIVSLTENELVIEREYTEQELDHQDLMSLFDELYELRYDFSCDNANDWSFAAYGAKACGGSQGYIAYPKEVEVAFLEKVEAYTALEKEFNIKWNIVSTCDLPSQPTSVECQNGYPILKY
ncbi:MAG: hypothetical protein ABJL44_08380 [Algibacter sp.]